MARPAQTRPAEQQVGGLGPFGDRGHREALGLLGRQVLERVHHEVDRALQEGELELLGEEALALHLVEGDVLDLVAPGLDDLEPAAEAELTLDPRRHVAGLPQGEIGSTGAEHQGSGHEPLLLPESPGPPGASSPSRKPSTTALV